MRIRRKEANGTLANLNHPANVVAPIQLIGKTFIKNIKVSINGQEIYNGNQLSAYKVFFCNQ